MSAQHYGEAFIVDFNYARLWGWQCLTPDCDVESANFSDLAEAEAFGEAHVRGDDR